MSKLIINKHQLRYIPEYDLYLQRVGVDNASVRYTCEHICSIYNICSSGYCRNKTRDPHYGNHGCADNGEQIVFLIQDNYSAKDIKDQIIEYGVQNLSPTVTPQIGDPEFLEE